MVKSDSKKKYNVPIISYDHASLVLGRTQFVGSELRVRDFLKIYSSVLVD